MKYSVKDAIRRRFINVIIITMISFIICISYLGIHKNKIEPLEKMQEIQITPQN
jgi:hypothetical protein